VGELQQTTCHRRLHGEMIIFSAAPEMGKLYTRRALGPQVSRPGPVY
jgi:hypothetical protein